MCWNMLHEQLFLLFVAANDGTTHMRSYEATYGIWHTIQSDKTQREMLEVAAKSRFGPYTDLYSKKQHQTALDKKVLAAILWITKMAAELSMHRNDAAHSPVYFALREDSSPRDPRFIVMPTASGRKQAVKRLSDAPTREIWRRVRGDLIALTGYASGYRLALLSDGRAPLPRKPRLLSVKQSPQKTSPKARRRPRKGPPSPPLT